MAMESPFVADFWKAMEVELDTLENEMKAWNYVDRTPDMKVLPLTWAFEVKRYLDGLLHRFCA